MKHKHELLVNVPPGLPPVYGVEWLLHEAIVNFITNAIKYTPDGGKIILRAIDMNDFVRIEVEDNGIGISPEDTKRLFNDFIRIKQKDTPVSNVEGSGLGLAIVKRVIEAHGGTVNVSSRQYKGSTFIIKLPT